MTRQEALQKARDAQKAAKEDGGDVAVMERPKRPVTTQREEEKMYHFQLLHEYPQNWKPTDKKTGKPLSPPYPRYWVAPNQGVAYDEAFVDDDGNVSPRAREWRYIEGQPSIWVDEQPLLSGMDNERINSMLGDTRNELKFEYGQMNVSSRQKLRMAALQVQDMFEGKVDQYRPKNREYKLHNPEKAVKDETSMWEREYAAQKMAHECTEEHMIECAFVMGIPISDQSDAGLARIKLEFLKRARFDEENPKALEWFTGIVANPLTHVEYTFAAALENNLLSTAQHQGRLSWTKANQAIMDINPNNSVVAQLMNKYNNDDVQTIKLFDELERQLQNI